MSPRGEVQNRHEYASIFTEWDTRSAVRSRPRRMMNELGEGKSPFSSALTPCASHPLLLARGSAAVDELLARRLYLYLDFTTVLEQAFVNPVLMQIARDGVGVTFTSDMKFDAYHIYCDEAYHALFSVDLRRQVEATTGVVGIGGYNPHFARVLRHTYRSLPDSLRPAIDLCFAIVSETLISGVLSALPTDDSVVTAVRESIADHAMDERRHHAYFAKVLDCFWPQLTMADRRLLGPLFGDFMLAFLDPDRRAHAALLRDMNFTADEADQIFHESHPADTVVADTRRAARSTLRLLERVGVFDDERIRDHYGRLELLPEHSERSRRDDESSRPDEPQLVVPDTARLLM